MQRPPVTPALLDASYQAFSQNRGVVTPQGARFEKDFAKSVASTQGLEAANAAASRQELGSPIPGMYVMYAVRESQYEIQLFPMPRELDKDAHAKFEDWHGDLMAAAKSDIERLGHTIEFYPNVENPLTKGPSETFCVFRKAALLSLGDSVVKEIVRRLVHHARTCEDIPASVRRAAGGV